MGVKTRRFFAWTGLVLLAVIALGLGIRAFFNYSNGKKLERYLAALGSKGMIADASALVQSCPDPDNAALLWKAAESLFILEPKDKSLLAPVSDVSGWKDFSPEEQKRLEAIIDKNRKAIDLYLEASGKSCFQYGDPARPPLERETPDFSLMIQATRLVIVDALLKAEKGQAEEAVGQILRGICLMKLCSGSPVLLNYLVSMANAKMLVHNLNRVVAGTELPAATLAGMLDSLDAASWRKAMVKAFQAEHAGFSLETYHQLLKGKTITGVNSDLPGRIYFWVIRPVLKSEAIWVSRHFEEMIQSAHEPFYRNEKARQWLGQEIQVPARYKLAGLLLPNLYTVILKEATLEAFLEAARIGLACRVYRSRKGIYPDKVADLVPDILKEEPLDPFTGQPLTYKSRGDAFIVYSLGSNGKDDSGRMSVMTQAVMEKDDDWSWRENWQ
jgi:hypothetical protein